MPISLRMVRSAQPQLYISESEQFRPKLAGKDSVPVRYYGRWHTMEAVNLVEKQLSDTRCCEGMQKWDEMSVLCKEIHHNQDAVSMT